MRVRTQKRQIVGLWLSGGLDHLIPRLLFRLAVTFLLRRVLSRFTLNAIVGFEHFE